ncbi:MAG TPA: ATP-binding protein [Prolixibacteraceae bacterium]|nr:ATP-binding protein [Prolixibacteraceae bacterium]
MKTRSFNRIIYLLLGNRVRGFEEKTTLLTIMLMVVILILATATNIILGMKTSIVISTVVGTLIFLLFFLYGRFFRINSIFGWITSGMFLLFIDYVWFINYGTHGPNLPFFIILYAFLILIFDKKYFVFISIVLVLNLIVLYLIESNYSDEIGNYMNNTIRLNDVYSSMFFSLVAIYAFMASIKSNYVREFERAKNSDQLKSAFLANMSHEIRTPLNAIVGFSSLMADPDISDEDKISFEEQVSRNSDYLLSLIDDIIDVSKIESNQLTINIREVDIVPLILQITETFQLGVQSKENVKIIARLDSSELKINVDKIRLEQIFRNLVANALKFTDEGTIEISCVQGKEFYTFSVKDTGIGIHVDDHLVIFDRFMKIDNNKQHLHRGTGIGLFLTKQLVEIFGGKIWVESEVGKGSIFYFTIPV